MAHKLTIDVSHIIGWQGNLTGIERVEFYLIKYYYEQTDADFVTWQADRKRFVSVSRSEIKRKIINRSSEDELWGDVAPSAARRLAIKIRRRLPARSNPAATYPAFLVLAGLWDKQDYIDGVVAVAQQSRVIHIIYDMIPLVQQQYVVDWLPAVYGHYMYSVLPHCAYLLAISKSSARDTAKVLKQEKLTVPAIDTFRLGDDITRAPQAEKPLPELQPGFILSVSTIEARKNHQLLQQVCERAQKEKVELPLMVVAGRRGWKTEAFQQAVVEDETLRDRLMILDQVTDANLRWLYENCLLTVFPSIYEGWGLPVAESLNYGKVTLSSNSSSMPEVGGNLADYFSPTSDRELLTLIKQYLGPQKRASREKYIREHYQPTLWAEAAQSFANKVDAFLN